MPLAQLTALTANINRDSKRKPKPFSVRDFCFFADDRKDADQFPPAAAVVALELRREGECPSPLIGCWPEVVAAADLVTQMPAVKYLKNADGSVYVLAPSWEGKNIRGTVVVSGQVSGLVQLKDPMRPLLTFEVTLKQREHYAYVSAGELLLGGS